MHVTAWPPSQIVPSEADRRAGKLPSAKHFQP
jgi:hypothetical protein